MTIDPLVWTAVVVTLGLLAFFEPCTVATHTLFSARAYALPRPARYRELAVLWAARSTLLTGLLILAVALTEPPVWGDTFPGVALAVMASVYIVSRFVYLPVPHLEFHRLLPGGRCLPHAVRLGFTLPACTLPLFAIVLGSTIALDSYATAITGALLFASLFTAPTAMAAVTGLSGRGLRLLNFSASVTSYITAGLLYAAAVYLLL